MRRLILLHVNRLTALKQILLTLPAVHPHNHVSAYPESPSSPSSSSPSPSADPDAMDTDPNDNSNANKKDSESPCDGTEKSVLRAWALATAYLAWEAQPDISPVKLAQILAPLLDQV